MFKINMAYNSILTARVTATGDSAQTSELTLPNLSLPTAANLTCTFLLTPGAERNVIENILAASGFAAVKYYFIKSDKPILVGTSNVVGTAPVVYTNPLATVTVWANASTALLSAIGIKASSTSTDVTTVSVSVGFD